MQRVLLQKQCITNSKQWILTIQNAGGVRADILPGNVTFNDAYTFLPFGNTLYTYKMEGSLVKQVLEDAMQFVLVDGSTGHSLMARAFVTKRMKYQMRKVNV